MKVKVEGLEELRLLLVLGQEDDVPVELPKILKENNPACLEKAVQCAQAWV